MRSYRHAPWSAYSAAAAFCLLAVPPVAASDNTLPKPEARTAAGTPDYTAPADEIVVVASKQARPLREVAAHVTVLTGDDLDSILAASVDDVFRFVPGIETEQAGTRFGAESINIRGIGGNRVAVLVDGVPLSDQFDVGTFSNATRDFLDTGLTTRIEVLHGPASALYGSNAIGGVVATQTPNPAEVRGAAGSGGSFRSLWRDADASLSNTAVLALGDGRNGLLVGGAQRTGHELPSAAAGQTLDERDVEKRTGLLKFVRDFAGGSSFHVAALYQDSSVQSDLRSMLGQGRFRSTTALVGDDDYRMSLLNAAWSFGTEGEAIEDGVLRVYRQSSLTRQRTLDERGAASRPVAIDRYFEFEQDIRGVELNLHRRVVAGDVAHRVAVGFEYRERLTDEFRDGLETGLLDGAASNVILGEAFPLRDFPRSRSRETGIFVQDSIALGDVELTAALRADRYELTPRQDDMYAEDYPFAEPVALSDSELSPKLGVTWRPADALDLYLQYAHGFRAPPYEDANIGLEIPVFNYRAVPNPALRSERSDSLEVGLRWRGERLSLRAGWFASDYDDFIESRVRIGTDPESGRILFQAQNLDDARISGVEAGFEWQPDGPLRDLRLDGSLFIADGENRDTGQPLASVGPAQAVTAISWQRPDGRQSVRLQATATAAWGAPDEDAFEPPGHVLLDLFLAQRLSERLLLRAAVHNAFDRAWWHYSAVRGLAADDPLLEHLAQPGRSFSLSLNLDW